MPVTIILVGILSSIVPENCRPCAWVIALPKHCCVSSREPIVMPPRPLSEDDERSHFDCGRDSLKRWGFEDVPFDPRRSMIIRMVDLEKSGVIA